MLQASGTHRPEPQTQKGRPLFIAIRAFLGYTEFREGLTIQHKPLVSQYFTTDIYIWEPQQS